MKAVRVSAFTLIELLVVIVIIGILSVMVAPDYLRFKQKIDLKDSTSLLQTGFQEAYSLARSRSRHFLVKMNDTMFVEGKQYFEIRECIDFGTNVGIDGLYNCSDTNPVPSASGDNFHRLEGNTVLGSADFEIHFYAPHGNMAIISPASDPLTITLDNNGLTTDLSAHSQSGLVTTDTP